MALRTAPRTQPQPKSHLRGGAVGLQQQRSPGFQEGPQLNFVLPADRKLDIAQRQDIVHGLLTHKIVLQFLCGQRTEKLRV